MPRTRPDAGAGSGLLGRVADAAFVDRRRTLLGWLALLVLAIGAVAAFGGGHVADYSTPGSDSEAASKLLDERFAGRSGDQVDVVWKAQAGTSAPAVQARIDRLLAQAERIDGVVPGAFARDAQHSPDGRTGPLIAVAETPAAGDRAAVDRLAAEIARDRAVASVTPPQYNDAGDTALLVVTPKDSPESAATKELVDRLRGGVLADAGVDVALGGQTASSVDQSTVTAARLPLFIGAVVLLSFALLVAAFRVPLRSPSAAPSR